MASSAIDIGTMIERRAEIRGGRPCISGTGVTVQRIAGWYKLGLNPDEISERIGGLSLAQVHAALAYYHANRDEIDSLIAADESEGDRAEKQYAVRRETHSP